MKKASHLSRCVKGTLRNMENVVGNFVTCTEGCYGRFKMWHEKSKWHTQTPTPPTLQYLTHAHSHITLAVAAMDSCFVLVRTHQHGIAPGQVSLTIIATCGSCCLGTARPSSHGMRMGRWISIFADRCVSKFKMKHEESKWDTQTPTPRSAVPYACAQPYHPGSGSHGQLFRPC